MLQTDSQKEMLNHAKHLQGTELETSYFHDLWLFCVSVSRCVLFDEWWAFYSFVTRCLTIPNWFK